MDESAKINIVCCNPPVIDEAADTTVEVIASSGPPMPVLYSSERFNNLPKVMGVEAVTTAITGPRMSGASDALSIDDVTPNGVEELQTFLNNFNSELAAGSQQHATVRLVESSSITSANNSYTVYETVAPATATLVYEGDTIMNCSVPISELHIVECSNSNVQAPGSSSTEQQEVILLPQSLSNHLQFPPNCQVAVSSSEALNSNAIVSGHLPEVVTSASDTGITISNQQQPTQADHQQQLLIPIDCSSALVDGNHIPPGSTLLLPVIPTMLSNGAMEVRIAGQAVSLPAPSMESTAEALPVLVQQPPQPILVIVSGSGMDMEVTPMVQEPPKKVPIARMKSPKKGTVKKKATRATSAAAVGLVTATKDDDVQCMTSSAEEKTDCETDAEGVEKHRNTAGATTTATGDKVAGSNEAASTAASSKRSVFQCQFCDYSNVKKYLLVRHMKSHSEDRPHVCHVCEKRFKTNNSLQNHVNTHTGFRPHQCAGCDAQFTTSGEMVRHMRYKHTQEKPHKCPNCDYASVELSKLKRHLRSHTGERPFQCRKCAYASPDMYKLKRHMRVHTGEKPYECDVCLQRFTQSNSLKAHKMIHTGNKPVYQCEFCSTSCGRKTDLRIHIQKLHTVSDRPLLCKKCDKTYPDRYSLKQHQRIHDGERCYSCSLCNYSAFTQRHLDVHMMVHRCEKPFECPIPQCVHAFRQKTALKRHMMAKHRNAATTTETSGEQRASFQCDGCPKKFRSQPALLRHAEKHRLAANGSASEAVAVLASSKLEPSTKRPSVSVDSETEESDEDEEDTEKLPEQPADCVRFYKCGHCDESFRHLVQLEDHCQLEHIAAEDGINPENVVYISKLSTDSVCLPNNGKRRNSTRSTDASSAMSGADDGEKSDAPSKTLDSANGEMVRRSPRLKRKCGGGRQANGPMKRQQLSPAVESDEIPVASTPTASAAVDLEEQRRKDLENSFGFTSLDDPDGEGGRYSAISSESDSLPVETSECFHDGADMQDDARYLTIDDNDTGDDGDNVR